MRSRTIIIMMITLVIMAIFTVVKNEPHTTLNYRTCSLQTYAQNDPFADSVAYVFADLMNLTPSQQGYNRYTVSPYPRSTAFGHATCNQSLANSDCATCLVAARATLSTTCGGYTGGQVGMANCTMRYENYPFA
ncbi:hypothetical protein ABFS82_14G198400 [Erythranthe guttata]